MPKLKRNTNRKGGLSRKLPLKTRQRFRRHMLNGTLRIILLSSLVWMIVVTLVISCYFGWVGPNGWLRRRKNEHYVEDDDPNTYPSFHSEKYINTSMDADGSDNAEFGIEFYSGDVPRTYPIEVLKDWHSPPKVNEAVGKAGEMGRAVEVPSNVVKLVKSRFEENLFNVIASDMISLNRSLRDVRMKSCLNTKYPPQLPMTSVVIIFHNEAWSTLLRTVWSVINRSPRTLLKEIILVDDASERDFLGKKLEEYVSRIPVRTIVMRTAKRTGIVNARLLGAKNASGEVLTFLDAHCECSEGWLEPLLSRIVLNRRTVVCPMIDKISKQTFEYKKAGSNHWGGFNWELNFRWFRIPKREMERRKNVKTTPIRTPTMAGGVFSIDKEYFYDIGSYDDGMNFWGAENLEMSFRIWQCGGVLEIVPCSHVGHIFRKKSPYFVPSNSFVDNSARVAEVWMDEYRDFYYEFNKVQRPSSDVSKRKLLRERLKCKSFRWFLKNIYPESVMPLNYYNLGEIRKDHSKICLDTGDKSNVENLKVEYCHGLGGSQLFLYTKMNQILSSEFCLEASQAEGPIQLKRCNNGTNQEWRYGLEDKLVRHVETGSCLQLPLPNAPYTPVLQPCDYSKKQHWVIGAEFKWQSH